MTTTTTGNTPLLPLNPTVPSVDPLQWFPRILTKLYSVWVGLTYPFASIGRKLSIHYTCDLPRSSAHRIKLGNSIQIRKDAIIQVIVSGGQEEEPTIIIDDDTCIGPRCLLSAKNFIHLGRDVMVAQSVLITDHPDAFGDKKATVGGEESAEGGRIRIGEGTWIGQRAAIVCSQGELVLGRNCVVAANAVVTRSFPAYSVLFGNPARVIKQFDQVKNAWVLGSAHFTRSEGIE